MRFNFNIDFDCNLYENKLPANNQYELSGWIYNTLVNV
jgi:hypothetical protein